MTWHNLYRINVVSLKRTQHRDREQLECDQKATKLSTIWQLSNFNEICFVYFLSLCLSLSFAVSLYVFSSLISWILFCTMFHFHFIGAGGGNLYKCRGWLQRQLQLQHNERIVMFAMNFTIVKYNVRCDSLVTSI